MRWFLSLALTGPLLAQAPLDEATLLVDLEQDLLEHVERARAATVLLWGVPGDIALLGPEWELPLGSGVVVSAEGVVLTAGHVLLYPGQPLRVQFADGRFAEAQALGKAGAGDLGMLEITAGGRWPFVERAPAATLERFDACFGLGYPGEVEAAPILRVGVVLEPDARWLRTTCAIMQGDSGGGLFDRQGRLVGIHSWIESALDRNYHAPVARFEEDWERLVRGELWEPLLDGRADPVVGERPSPTLLFGFSCEASDAGPCVHSVQPDSSAARAGLLVGDLLESVAGRRVRNLGMLERWMRIKRREPRLELRVARDGDARVVVLERPNEGPLVAAVGEDFVQREDGAYRGVARVSSTGARKRRVALATVVRADGLLVTKASELGDEPPRVELDGGEALDARVVGVDAELDIALLAVAAEGLPVPDWGAGEELAAGRLVVSLVDAGRPARVGVVDAPAAKVRHAWRGALGARVADLDDPEAIGLLVRRPRPGSPAADVGMLKGDVLLALDGEELRAPKQLKRLMKLYAPGDEVVFRVRRGPDTLDIEVELCEPGGWWAADDLGHVADNLSLSDRRDGFASAFRHDALVPADECGSPVFDLHGKVVGINIARTDRVGEYAIPIERVLASVEALLAADEER